MPPRRRATGRTRSGGRRLTAAQRNKLPDSAFIDRAHRRFPVPNKAQAARAGIPEAQRVGILRNALARAAQRQPARQARGRGGRKVAVKTVTPTAARRAVRQRGGGAVASVRRSTTTRRRAPARRRRTGRRRR
jgi:hypothetical protein